MIENVSFVIIARNEEFALQYCISGLGKLNCSNCEFIFVDSDSADSTLTLMKEFDAGTNKHSVIKISGEINAAVARNTGLNEASKEFVFFIDGDTSVEEHFVTESIKRMENDQTILATMGQLAEQVYDPKSQEKIKFIEDRFNISSEKPLLHTGGNVFVRRDIANQVGGWNESFTVNEDYEFSLKISKRGTILGLSILMGIHNTFPYVARSFQYFLKGHPRFTGIILRMNLKRSDVIKEIVKTQSGIFIGVVYYILLVLSVLVNIWYDLNIGVIFLVSTVLLVLDVLKGIFKKQDLLRRAIIRFLYSLRTLQGFLTYQIKKQNKVTVEKVLS